MPSFMILNLYPPSTAVCRLLLQGSRMSMYVCTVEHAPRIHMAAASNNKSNNDGLGVRKFRDVRDTRNLRDVCIHLFSHVQPCSTLDFQVKHIINYNYNVTFMFPARDGDR